MKAQCELQQRWSPVAETLGFFAVAQNIVLYHLFEMILVFRQTIPELRSLLLPDDLMYITAEPNLALTTARSFPLLTVA